MKTLEQAYSTRQMVIDTKRSLVQRFFNWCARQEEKRLLWLGIIIGGHGCVITPITVFFIILGGNLPVFWPFAIGAITMSLVVNLAALPTKITLPVFFFSLLIDLVIIINCISLGLAFPPVS